MKNLVLEATTPFQGPPELVVECAGRNATARAD
jgi:hypothetical protein